MEMYSNMLSEIGAEIYNAYYWIGLRDTDHTHSGLRWDHDNSPAFFPGMEAILEDLSTTWEKCCRIHANTIRDWICHRTAKYICMKGNSFFSASLTQGLV